MFKIGIITISKINNYGADLQAYALQKKLVLMGYNAEIIDYLFYKHPLFKRERQSEPFYQFPLKKRMKEWILPVYERIKSFPYKQARKEREKAFHSFHQEHTNYSKDTFHNYSELFRWIPEYDIYCTGSDQVWNPNCYTSLFPYLLSFVPNDKKKISYASSFGVSTLPTDAIDKYKNELCKYHHIAVREKKGIEIIKEIANKEATIVVDPTLLLTKNEWSKIARTDKVPDNPYILLYVLKDSSFITKTALQLSQKYGLPIIRICKGTYRQDSHTSIQNIMDAGPQDFLGLFMKASIILTNSYHGTIFSLIFEKIFYTILKANTDNNSRQQNLLSELKLENRLIYEPQFKEQPALDYSAINQRIQTLRLQSESYLKNAIEN